MSGRSLRTLQKEARLACLRRGHDMAPFKSMTTWEEANGFPKPVALWQRAKCRKCGREVDIKTHPSPNDIDIGGEAVALGCTT